MGNNKLTSDARKNVDVQEVFLVDFLRTPFSRSRPRDPERDVFHEYDADQLLGLVLKELVARAPFEPEDVEDVITGCAYQVRQNWLYGGRHPVFLGELPVSVAAMGLDRQCGSSMSCVHVGAMEIMTGNAEVVIACGMEHMTRIPMGNDWVLRHAELADSTRFPNHAKYDLATGYSMIQTAQKLWEQTPGVTREDMDQWALESHAKAARARDEGFFDGEILPVEGRGPDGEPVLVKHDQSIREDSSLEDLAKLRVVSKGIEREGQITPGNASPLNAGAAACALVSGKVVEELAMKPLAKIRSMSWAGVSPGVMGSGPVPASRKALKRSGLRVDEVDFWEINEAFAIVPLHAAEVLGIERDRINVKGGAIALGHPLGATGVRIVGTLARILQLEGGRFGLATACVGGGQGVATVLERV
ncbi:MAG: acetyl-CoA C-acetyltransferase [Promethearchaeota archaeon]